MANKLTIKVTDYETLPAGDVKFSNYDLAQDIPLKARSVIIADRIYEVLIPTCTLKRNTFSAKNVVDPDVEEVTFIL